MSDPSVWGPLLIAASVVYVGWRIEYEIRESARQRDKQHRVMMDVLNIFPDEIDQLKFHLSCIEKNGDDTPSGF